VVCWKENNAAQDDDRAGYRWEQGIDFDLVETSWMVVVHETPGVARTTCCQVLPL
jgi:hypothetical protein